MAKIAFTRSESWKDYMGKRSCCHILRGKEKIGTIDGDSGCGIPVMQYTVTVRGNVIASAYSLREAKQLALEALTS